MLQNSENDNASIFNFFYAQDSRGSFQKLYQSSFFKDHGGFIPKESYISKSKPNVLRGFHLQVNESAHKKLCTCLTGKILDVIVDLRKGENFGKTFSTILDSEEKNSIFIPIGFGHAFLNISNEEANVLYFVETEHDPKNDTGVLWNSVNFDWPIKEPILSDRDKLHKPIQDFNPL